MKESPTITFACNSQDEVPHLRSETTSCAKAVRLIIGQQEIPLDVQVVHTGANDIKIREAFRSSSIIILGGGEISAHDSEMSTLIDETRRAVNEDTPVFGICLGLQLLAKAMGGEVENCPHGRSQGVEHIYLTQQGKNDPVLQGQPSEMDILTSHGECVTSPPKDAIVLAKNQRREIEGLRINNAVGVQGHPERDPGLQAKITSTVLTRLHQHSLIPKRAESIRKADLTASSTLIPTFVKNALSNIAHSPACP